MKTQTEEKQFEDRAPDMQIQANEPRRQRTNFRLEAGVALRCLSEEIEFTSICVLPAGQRPPLNEEWRFQIQALPTHGP
jgi:hypothetical protein